MEKGINAVADAADADRGMYCRADNHRITRHTDPTASLRHVLSPDVVAYNPNAPCVELLSGVINTTYYVNLRAFVLGGGQGCCTDAANQWARIIGHCRLARGQRRSRHLLAYLSLLGWEHVNFDGRLCLVSSPEACKR
jgi:hypothetical protein